MNLQINLLAVLFLLFGHWIADFVLQTDKQAQGKSKNWSDLLGHTVNYSCFMWICYGIIYIVWLLNNGLEGVNYFIPPAFAGITFVAHTCTDYITSRINSSLWAQKRVHAFFVSVGFDQLLHYIQLILTYQFLSKYW